MIIKGNTVGHPVPDLRNGLTMQGAIDMNGQALTGLKAPEAETDAVTKEYADTKQAQHQNRVVILSVSKWSNNRQTVSVSGIKAEDTVFSTPDIDSREMYAECNIRLSEQDDGVLTYVCEEVPAENLTVNVTYLPFSGAGVTGGSSSGGSSSGGSSSGGSSSGSGSTGGGGDFVQIQSDWNQTDSSAADFIKNKPFGEVGGDTLRWDGSYDVNEIYGEIFVKISDAVPTVDDVVNGITLDFGEIIEFSGDEAQSYFSDDGFASFEFILTIIPHDNYILEIEDGLIVEFPKAGVYSITDLSFLTATIPNYVGFTLTNKLDAKYIPDMGTVKQTVVYVAVRDGVNRIFKDEECTEMLSHIELYTFAKEPKRVVVVDGDGMYDAVAVQYSYGTILYIKNSGGENVIYRVAYDADSEP